MKDIFVPIGLFALIVALPIALVKGSQTKEVTNVEVENLSKMVDVKVDIVKDSPSYLVVKTKTDLLASKPFTVVLTFHPIDGTPFSSSVDIAGAGSIRYRVMVPMTDLELSRITCQVLVKTDIPVEIRRLEHATK